MKSKILSCVLFLLIFYSLACNENDNAVEPFNYERDTPIWLKEKIDSMLTNPNYFGTKVYRYEWNNKFIYHIMIPISSCAYCELYDQDGNKVLLNNDMFSDFLKNKRNETLVWQWGK